MIIHGDCLEVLKTYPDNHFTTIVTDAPYGFAFMGKRWDYDVPSIEIWQQCLRVLKPGGTLLCFAGSRTQHRMAVNIEDAGFMIKDCLMWLYSSGFPKATDITKQLQKNCTCGNMEEHEKAKSNTKYYLRLMQETNISKTFNSEGQQREILQSGLSKQSLSLQQSKPTQNVWQEQSIMEGWCHIETSERELQRCKICALSERILEDGKERWLCNGTPFGYGTTSWKDTPEDRSCSSYRPQSEQQQNRKPCSFCQQYASQNLRTFVGYKSHALKPAYEPIILAMKPNDGTYAENALKWGVSGINIEDSRIGTEKIASLPTTRHNNNMYAQDEWTKNNIIGEYKENIGRYPANIIVDEEIAKDEPWKRYFYCAKASKAERNAGCEGLQCKKGGTMFTGGGGGPMKTSVSGNIRSNLRKNHHPTVKPLALMEYLIKLVMPPKDGLLLDPFAGSGTTIVAAKRLGFEAVGIEKEQEYCDIAETRLKHEAKKINETVQQLNFIEEIYEKKVM